MKVIEYQRNKLYDYAKKWALKRNPNYYNFDAVGGDCTNFASQCLFTGSQIMNYQQNGWFYTNGNKKSPSWSGVEYLYQFLIQNKSVGPFGKEVKPEELEIGDIIQLSFNQKTFSHTLVVVEPNKEQMGEIKIASHTYDAFNKRIVEYFYQDIRFIHIEGVRIW